ncbi:response regulator [Paraburkholderia sabiae]|jgi:two-component system phosphate regulon response regulator OmpR|uniref:Response regulator transcription factor n=1 Tax=Paraburkholderia sabiae TaxID=273251 RepID=A0ABU9QBB7_9BURK|nr:response regulator transcription factor [Paraburkholderia sabiae]WJZ71515.1 response regulator transcription factor [Paraburkholderia sabiae]CAD6543878.1 Transcriptional regulatory protein OmpR [Paraburkholderia sabiae]CAG9189836.1 Two component transcriptional regulator, winged helix family [Paraburkholderia sabiae]
MTIHLLVVEPNQESRDVLRSHVQQHKIEMSVLYNTESLERRLEVEVPSLIVMRHSLPEVDGLAALRRVRSLGYDLPVIIVSKSDDVVDKVLAFELGANDYVVDPHDPREMIARVRNALRSGAPSHAPLNIEREPISFDDFDVDVADRVLTRGGVEVPLRSTEFALLVVLASHPMKVLSRVRILNMLRRHCSVTERGLDVVVFRLRAALKLSPTGRQYIKTLRGEGYMFAPDDALPKHASDEHAHSEDHTRMLDLAGPVIVDERMRFEGAARLAV